MPLLDKQRKSNDNFVVSFGIDNRKVNRSLFYIWQENSKTNRLLFLSAYLDHFVVDALFQLMRVF